jgi:hypothetical protein
MNNTSLNITNLHPKSNKLTHATALNEMHSPAHWLHHTPVQLGTITHYPEDLELALTQTKCNKFYTPNTIKRTP